MRTNGKRHASKQSEPRLLRSLRRPSFTALPFVHCAALRSQPPLHSCLLLTHAYCLSARGKHHRSTDHFISLIVMLSNQLDHSSRYEKKTLAMGHIYFQRGMAYAFIGSGDKAIKDYGMCIEIFNQHKQPCSQAYFNRSILRYDEGGKEGLAAALEDVSTAISQDPGNITYFKNRALLLRKKDDFLKSITDVEFVNRLTKKKIETEKKSGRRLSLTSTKPSRYERRTHRSKHAAPLIAHVRGV